MKRIIKLFLVVVLSCITVITLVYSVQAEETQEEPIQTEEPTNIEELQVINEEEIEQPQKVTEEDLQELQAQIEEVQKEREIIESQNNYLKINNDTSSNSVMLANSTSNSMLDLLWTNPNPTASFSAQTINVDLSAYDVVGIVFTVEPGTPVRISNLFYLVKGISYGEGSCVGGVLQYMKSRVISGVTDIGISFGDGYNATNSSNAINNRAMIPLYIYGIKNNFESSGSGGDSPSSSTDLTKLENNLEVNNQLLVSLNLGVVSSFVGTVLFRTFKR